MLFHNIPAVQLVPKHAVVKIRGVLHHVGGVFLPAEDAVLVDVPLVGDPLAHNPVEVRHHQIAPVLLHGPHQEFGRVRGNPVVGVQELEIAAPGLAEAEVPGAGHAGILLVEG